MNRRRIKVKWVPVRGPWRAGVFLRLVSLVRLEIGRGPRVDDEQATLWLVDGSREHGRAQFRWGPPCIDKSSMHAARTHDSDHVRCLDEPRTTTREKSWVGVHFCFWSGCTT